MIFVSSVYDVYGNRKGSSLGIVKRASDGFTRRPVNIILIESHRVIVVHWAEVGSQALGAVRWLADGRPKCGLQCRQLCKGLLLPASVAHQVNKFQRTKGIKPLVKLTLELCARRALSLAVREP